MRVINPKLYNLDLVYEQKLVTTICSFPKLWDRLGTHFDPELFKSESAKLAMRAARAIARDVGHGPTSTEVVIQRLRGWMGDGKVKFEDIKDLAEYFDEARDSGLLDEEEAVAEMAPMLQQQLRDQAVKLGIESFGKKGDLSKVVELENKAVQIGRRSSTLERDAGPSVITLANVVAEPLNWLWRGRIPRGKLTIIDGDPGLGKSTLTLDIAARVSAGQPMPFATDADASPCADVLLLCSEDAPSDTLRPRLDAAGGDPARVHFVDEALSLPDGIDRLEVLLQRYDPDLLIIDPLMAFLGKGIDSHRDQDVRRVLTPLARLAEKYGCAILLVRHLNKAGHNKAILRGGGSVGIIGAARAASVLARDPTDPNVVVLASTKNNVGRAPPAVRLRVVTADNGAGRIEYIDECNLDADSLLEPAPSTSSVDRAKEFLHERLAAGPVPTEELKADAARASISWRSVERAKKEDPSIASEKVGRGWQWSLTAHGDDGDDDRAAVPQ